MLDEKNIYIPTEEDIDEAESMMTDEQKELSETRAENWEQEQPPWEEYNKVDKNFVRTSPSPEAVERMDKSLEELGQVFEGSDLNWHLDGAMNISLLKGEYIGEHKDVDISIEKNELEAVEAQLLKNGYGLFLSRTEDVTKNKVLKRVDYTKFKDSDTEHMIIAAIDEDGKINRDKELGFIDVHTVERDETGSPLGESKVPIPEKWFQPQPMEFHGQQINLSHPSKVLYYKLHQNRGYDITDTQRLIETGKITEEDVDDIEKIYEEEFKVNIEGGRKVFEKVASQITPEMSSDDIYKVMNSQSDFSERDGMEEGLRQLAQEVAEAEDKSTNGILNIAIKVFKVEEENDRKREKISDVKQLARDAQEIKNIQKELKK